MSQLELIPICVSIVFVLLAAWIKSWALSSGFAQAVPVLIALLGVVIIALLRLSKPTT